MFPRQSRLATSIIRYFNLNDFIIISLTITICHRKYWIPIGFEVSLTCLLLFRSHQQADASAPRSRECVKLEKWPISWLEIGLSRWLSSGHSSGRLSFVPTAAPGPRGHHSDSAANWDVTQPLGVQPSHKRGSASGALSGSHRVCVTSEGSNATQLLSSHRTTSTTTTTGSRRG